MPSNNHLLQQRLRFAELEPQELQDVSGSGAAGRCAHVSADQGLILRLHFRHRAAALQTMKQRLNLQM